MIVGEMKHVSKEYWADLIQRNSVIGDEIVKYSDIQTKEAKEKLLKRWNKRFDSDSSAV